MRTLRHQRPPASAGAASSNHSICGHWNDIATCVRARRAYFSILLPCGEAVESKGLHGHQLPEMDVPRFFNGQPLPDPFQHQRLFLRKTITLVILPEEEPAS